MLDMRTVGLSVAVGSILSSCILLPESWRMNTQHKNQNQLEWLEQGTGNTVPDPNPPLPPAPAPIIFTEPDE
jgi:hypothetical protein